VNHVLMRNTVLPRPYEGVTTILEAHGRCIAWPHDSNNGLTSLSLRNDHYILLVSNIFVLY
jgi:hypothetical protein